MRKFILPIMLLMCTCIHAQFLTNIDSARRVLQPMKDDTAKANLLHQLTRYYSASNEDSAFIYATQEYNLVQKLNYAKGLAVTYGDFSYYNFYFLENGPRALEYAYKMLPIVEKLKDSSLLARCYSSLAGGYSLFNNYREELLWQKKSYAIEFASVGYRKAIHMGSLGYSYYNLNMPDSSLFYYQQSYRIIDSLNDKRELCFPLFGLAYGSFALNKPEEGKMYSRHLIDLSKSSGNSQFLALAYYMLSKQFLKENKKDLSLNYSRNSANILESSDHKGELIDVYNLLVKLFQSNNEPDSAFKYEAKIVQVKDSAEAESNRNQLQSIAFEQTMQEQEKAAEIQKAKERLRNQVMVYSLLAALTVFGLIALILYRNNARKQKANKLLQQQKQETDEQKIKVEKTLEELKSTQAQLIQSEKMASLGELTAGIAHEIQNPLNFVNNFSEVNKEMIAEMKEEINKGNYDEVKLIANDIEDNSEKINHHGKRADAIVKGMLQHSRSSVGVKEPTNISALADEYLRLSYHGLRAKDKGFNATMKTDFDNTIEKINIIPQDIGRVLLNLYNNAFYACAERSRSAVQQKQNELAREVTPFEKVSPLYEPTVSVTTKKSENHVIITVSDNGNGIPQNIVDKIFQPFFTTKPTGEGTGLGLSLSYDIIKAHGGEIKVETKEGEGTEFLIQLPLKENL